MTPISGGRWPVQAPRSSPVPPLQSHSRWKGWPEASVCLAGGQVARGTVGGALSGLGGFMGWRMAKPLVKPMLRLAGRTAIRGAFLPAYAIGGALQQTADLTGESLSRTAEIYGNAKLQDSLLANRMYRQDQERGRDPRLTVQQRADQGSDHAKMLLRNMPDYRNMAYNEATQKYINDRSTQTKGSFNHQEHYGERAAGTLEYDYRQGNQGIFKNRYP